MIFSLIIWLFSFAAEANQPNEDLVVKATYIEKFSRFVTWPKQENSNDSCFVIGVYNSANFVEILENVYANKTIKNKPVTVKNFHNSDKITSCQVLYIAKDIDNEVARILMETKNLPILTISHATGFAEKGVIINFVSINHKRSKFKINQSAVMNSGLRISYILFCEAEVVNKVKK